MDNPSVIPTGDTKCSYFLVPFFLCRILHNGNRQGRLTCGGAARAGCSVVVDPGRSPCSRHVHLEESTRGWAEGHKLRIVTLHDRRGPAHDCVHALAP